MSIYINNSMNNNVYPQFKGMNYNASEIINKPVGKVENVINNTVDSFVKESDNEEKKKSHKTAITAGSSVLVFSTLVALLNPKFSNKLISKLQNTRFGKDIAGIFQMVNNTNSAKDMGFKWLCSAEKFKGIKNDTLRNILVKINKGFTKVMTAANNAITNGFDFLSKNTVKQKNKNALKKMDSLEELINTHKNKLSASEQKVLETKLAEIKTAKKYFSEEETISRLANQERIMSNLKNDFNKQFFEYCGEFKGIKSPGTFKQKMKHNINHFKNNMTFWAEDILMPQRNIIESEGKNAVNKLVGDGISSKGKYDEIIDIIAPHLSKEENAVLENSLKKVNKNLKKANKSECIEYFDKKRDLVLGSAPTDILTGIGVLGLSGIAIGTADTKDERISRLLTLGFPAIAGIGTSMALTSMLFSGTQGIIIGSAASAGLSRMGSAADKMFNPKKPDIQPKIKNSAEVNYA